MSSLQLNNSSTDDIPEANNYILHQLLRQSFQHNIRDVERAYLGTYKDINQFIDEAITDALYAKLMHAYTVDDTKPGYISYQVDVSTIPISGQFFYITGNYGQIHVFKATADESSLVC